MINLLERWLPGSVEKTLEEGSAATPAQEQQSLY